MLILAPIPSMQLPTQRGRCLQDKARTIDILQLPQIIWCVLRKVKKSLIALPKIMPTFNEKLEIS